VGNCSHNELEVCTTVCSYGKSVGITVDVGFTVEALGVVGLAVDELSLPQRQVQPPMFLMVLT